MHALIYCPSSLGTGETALGIEVARAIISVGGTVRLILSATQSHIADGVAKNPLWLLPASPKINRTVVMDAMGSEDPDLIVIADYLAAQYSEDSSGVRLDELLRLGIPSIVLDLYGWDRASHSMEAFGERRRILKDHQKLVDYWLCPVPTCRMTSASVRHFIYKAYTPFSIASVRSQRNFRHHLAVKPDNLLVGFTTSYWQHYNMNISRIEWPRVALQETFDLLANSRSCTLVHIGPNSLIEDGIIFPDGLEYRWLPPTTPNRYDEICGLMDVHLSLNRIAVTSARSIISGIPTVFVRSSCTEREISGPVYPFDVWPLGWSEFIQECMDDNTYSKASGTVDLVNSGAAEKMEYMISDEGLEGLKQAAQGYASEVSQLPSLQTVMTQLLEWCTFRGKKNDAAV